MLDLLYIVLYEVDCRRVLSSGNVFLVANFDLNLVAVVGLFLLFVAVQRGILTGVGVATDGPFPALYESRNRDIAIIGLLSCRISAFCGCLLFETSFFDFRSTKHILLPRQ